MMRLFFVFMLLLGICLPISASMEGNEEQFLDGYDHSSQNYLTERFCWASERAGQKFFCFGKEVEN